MSSIKIQSNASGTGSITIAAPNTDATQTLTIPDQTGKLMATGGGPINVSISAADNSLRINSAGNLGLEVTPQTWRSTYSAMQIGGMGSLDAVTSPSAGNVIDVSNNSYINASNAFTYIHSDYATVYRQGSGNHIWYNAPSGTADNPITLTQAMTLDSSGRLGIGVTSPVYALQIGGEASPVLGIKSSTDTGQSIIAFGDNTANGVGSVTYDHTSNYLAITVNAVERARITSDGYLRMASGSGGIQFNGDTVAANALDDYEEGTFTPTIVGVTTAGTGTYTSQVGRYTKIGNRVFIQIQLAWTAHTGTGTMRVGGLPYGINNNPLTFAIYHHGMAMTAGNTAQCYGLINTSQIVLSQIPTGGGTDTLIPIDAAVLSLVISGHYEV